MITTVSMIILIRQEINEVSDTAQYCPEYCQA